jgi:hypothetical protein
LTGGQTIIIQDDIATATSDDNPLAILNNLPQPTISGLDVGEFLTVLSANFTMTNALGAQKAFNASTNGALALAGNTLYEFEATYYIVDTGTTSHTWGVLFGGTATITSGLMHAMAHAAATNVLTAVQESSRPRSARAWL